MFIDEAKDLDVFSAEGDVGGYYKVVNDIDASGFTKAEITGYRATTFVGVFDGQGYTISNITIPNWGIFGNISGVVRNVGIVNPNMIQGSASNSSNRTVFAYNVNETAVLSNIYIKSALSNTNHTALLAHNEIESGATLSNIVIEHAVSSTDTSMIKNSSRRYAMLSSKVSTTNIANVYVVSKAPLIKDGSNNLYVAENQLSGGAIVNNSYLTGKDFKDHTFASINAISGVKAYETYSAMSSANNTLTGFDSKYWTVSNGVAYWNGVAESYVEAVVRDSENNVVTNYTLSDTETKLSVSLEPTAFTYEDLQIVVGEGLTLDGNKVSLKENVTTETTFEVTLKAKLNGVDVTRTIVITAVPVIVEVNSEIIYTLENKTLDINAINEETGETITTIDGYYVEGDETLKTGDIILPINVKEDKSDVETQEVKLLANGKIYKVNNVKAYSMFIDEAKDLDVFSAAGDVDGYYKVVNDIDATGFTKAQITSYEATDFVGVFDGQGYTISNLTIPNWGIFGNISGVVRNVGIVNATMTQGTASTSSNRTILAYDINGGAELSNIYIKSSLSNGGHTGILAHDTIETNAKLSNVVIEHAVSSTDTGMIKNSSRRYAILSSAVENAILSNVYVVSKAPLIKDGSNNLYVAENQLSGGAIVNNSYLTGKDFKDHTFASINAISGVKAYETYSAMSSANNTLTGFDSKYWTVSNGVAYWNGVAESYVEAVVRDSENNVVTNYTLSDTETKLSVSLEPTAFTYEDLQIVVGEGLTLDGNKVSLKENVTTETTFEVTLKAKLNGVDVTRTIVITAVPVIVEVNSEIIYTLENKTLDINAINEETGETITTIDGYYVEGDETLKTGDIILPINVKEDKSDVETQEVKLLANGKIYKVNNVKAYSMFIDEAKDLDVFSAEGDVGGYYKVVNDIDASGFTKAEITGYRATTFVGVFDGQGYTISNITIPNWGIFGNISGVVRNVGIVNPNMIQGSASNSSNRTVFAYNVNETAVLSNIYIKSALSNTNHTALLAHNEIESGATLSNIVIEHAVSSTDTSMIKNSSRRYSLLSSAVKTTNISNVYVVSKAPLIKDGSNNLYVAENQLSGGAIVNNSYLTGKDFKDHTFASINAISGVKAYETYSAMSSANNTLTGFDSKYWTVSNGVAYWNGVAESYVEAVVRDSENNVVTNYTLSDTETKLSVSLEPTAFTYEDLQIVVGEGLTLDGNKVSLKENVTTETTFEVTLKAKLNGVDVERTIVITAVPNIVEVNSVINYSLEEKSFDFNAINNELNSDLTINDVDAYCLNGNTDNVITGNDITLEVVIEEGNVNSQVVTFVVDNTYYQLNNVKAYTKYVYDVEDLNGFSASDEINGAYLLNNNIDAGGAKLTAKASSGSTTFAGVFDGNGYTLYNLTIQNWGIFGNISGAVKNLAVVNPTLIQGDAGSSNRTVFAHRINDNAILSNIYIEHTLSSNGHMGILAYNRIEDATISNVVIKHNVVANIDTGMIKNSSRGYAVFGPINGNPTFTNAYAITTAPIVKDGSNNLYVAENQYDNGSIVNNAYLTGDDFNGHTFASINAYPGVKAYTDYTAMKDANNTYTTFNSCWDITAGYPVWKTANDFAETSISGTELTDTATELTITTDSDDAVITTSSSNVAINDNVITLKEVPVNNESYVVTVRYSVNGTVVIRHFTITAPGYANSIEPVVKDSEGEVVSDYVLNNPDEFFTITLNDDRATITSVVTSNENLVWDSEAGTIKMTAYPDADATYEVTITATVDGEEITRVITVIGKAYVKPSITIDEVVAYSAADGYVDLIAINKKLEANNYETIKLSDIEKFDLNGAGATEFALTEGVGNIAITPSISGSGANMVVSGTNSIVLTTNSIDITLTNVVAYTLFIDEATDLAKISGSNSLTGYAVLVDNINANGVTVAASSYSKYCLQGTFDGQGYTISNLKVNQYGIFGRMDSKACVKNIAFVDTIIANSGNACLIGRDNGNSAPSFKDIYIGNIDASAVSGNNRNFGIFAVVTVGNTIGLSNIVINDFADSNELDGIVKYSLISNGFTGGAPTMQNCYVISDAPLAYDGTTAYVASNQYVLNTETTEVADDYKLLCINATLSSRISAATIATISGVKAYDSYQAMANDKTGDVSNNAASLETFNSAYWDTTAGYPVWKTLPASN